MRFVGLALIFVSILGTIPGVGNGDDFGGTGDRFSGDLLRGDLKFDGIGEVASFAAVEAILNRLTDRLRRNEAAGDIGPLPSSSLESLLLSLLLLQPKEFVAFLLSILPMTLTTLLLVGVGEGLLAVFAAHDADL